MCFVNKHNDYNVICRLNDRSITLFKNRYFYAKVLKKNLPPLHYETPKQYYLHENSEKLSNHG